MVEPTTQVLDKPKEDCLTLDEILQLAGKVKNWITNDYIFYTGSIGDVALQLKHSTYIHDGHTPSYGISVHSNPSGIELGKYYQDSRIKELYDSVVREIEENEKKKKQEISANKNAEKINALACVRAILKQP